MRNGFRKPTYNYPTDPHLGGESLVIIRGIHENGKVPMIRSGSVSVNDKDYRKRIVHRLIQSGEITSNLQVTEKGLIAIGAKKDEQHG